MGKREKSERENMIQYTNTACKEKEENLKRNTMQTIVCSYIILQSVYHHSVRHKNTKRPFIPDSARGRDKYIGDKERLTVKVAPSRSPRACLMSGGAPANMR